MGEQHTIFVVEDDPPVLNSTCRLLQSAGFWPKGYASAEAFLDDYDPDQSGCLVLDIYLEGMNGLKLQARLKQEQITVPVVFVSAYGRIPMVVDAMKAGAIGFLEKPFHEQEFFELIRFGLERDEIRRLQRRREQDVKQRQAALTAREIEVMEECVRGKSTKQIALDLGISPKTVDKHKVRMLHKMGVENPVELTRLCFGRSERVPD